MPSYVERPVHAALAQLAVCTWVDQPAEQRHPVLPDACIDLVWDGARLQVAGPDTGPSPVLSQATFVGLRFRPGAAPSVLGVPASDLLDRSVSLVDLWGTAADELAERLADQPSQAPRLLEHAVLARRGSEPDPLIPSILRHLARDEPEPPIVETLAKDLGVSERTLRRRCVDAVGYGPKMLDRVLRFRRALRLIRAGVPLVEAAQLAGYADQAHLTNEFQRLAGAAPSQLSRLSDVAISSNGLVEEVVHERRSPHRVGHHRAGDSFGVPGSGRVARRQIQRVRIAPQQPGASFEHLQPFSPG